MTSEEFQRATVVLRDGTYKAGRKTFRRRDGETVEDRSDGLNMRRLEKAKEGMRDNSRRYKLMSLAEMQKLGCGTP